MADKIAAIESSMEDMPFREEEFDIMWSEGAVYNMGFENGIKKWKDYLKAGGYLVVSEITWITRTRPKEIDDFWKGEYPEADMASNKIRQLERNGYTLAGYFYLSQDSWTEGYYTPLKAGFEAFLKRNGNSEAAAKVVAGYRAEMELYEKYKDHCSYGFYIARKK
jgi:SAM-dependent methyltransferase